MVEPNKGETLSDVLYIYMTGRVKKFPKGLVSNKNERCERVVKMNKSGTLPALTMPRATTEPELSFL